MHGGAHRKRDKESDLLLETETREKAEVDNFEKSKFIKTGKNNKK